MAHDVFVSHSSKDHEIAVRLCASLEDEGLRCWMAPRDIPAGADWSASIVEAIRHSRALVLILSRNSSESVQIPREIERAVNAKVPIVPVRVENVLPSGPLEYSLSTVHWFDAFASPVESRAHALSEEIRALSTSSDEEKAEAEKRRLAAIEQRRARRRIELRRSAVAALAVSAGVTLLAAMVSKTVPLQSLDNKLLDWRFTLASPRLPSDRIVVVSIDDASLAADATPLNSRERADEVGRTISRLFDSGAKAVAIDLLLSSLWSQSQPFADAVVRHHEKLTLAAGANADGSIIGPEVLSGLVTAFLGPPAAGRMFGLVNLPPDGDGVVRRVPLNFTDRGGEERPAWSTRAAQSLSGGAPATSANGAPMLIDFRVDDARFRRISWKEVAMFMETGEPVFRDRLVLIGAEYDAAGDTHATPSPRGTRGGASGLVVQALAINTILDNRPVRDAGRGWPLAMTAVIALGVAFAAAAWRPRIAVAALAGGIAVIVAIAVAVFVWKGSVAPIAGPSVAAIIAAAVSMTIAKRIIGRGAQL